MSFPILRRLALLVISVCFVASSWAQATDQDAAEYEPVEQVAAAEDAEPTPLAQEVTDRFDSQLASVEESIVVLRRLETEVDAAEGLRQRVLERRLQREWVGALDTVLTVAEEAADLRDQGFDVSAYSPILIDYLRRIPSAIWAATEKIRTALVFPDSALPPAEQVQVDEKFFASSDLIEGSLRQLARSLEVARRFGLDMDAEERALTEELEEVCQSVSILLDMARDEASRLKVAAAALPNDADVAARLTVAEARIPSIVQRFQSYLALAESMGIQTAVYRQQLLSVTGQISAETLNFEVITGFIEAWRVSVLDSIKAEGPSVIFGSILFLVIILVFFKLAGIVEKLVDRTLAKNAVRTSQLLRRMVTSWSRNVVIIIGVLVGLSQVGVSILPVLTGLGIVGFIVGFALQDSLSNFASGMLILVYQPFDVGDTVEVAGVFGKVNNMSLVNTTILTLDNQTLIVPNNKIWQDIIKNLTNQNLRRVDMVFGVSYDTDLDHAERVLNEVIAADERVLDYPETNIRVHELADSSVNFIVRPWVKTDDYWDLYWDMMKRVKQRFDEEGIGIPFPQRDVHLYTTSNDSNPPLASGPREPSQNSRTGARDNDPVADEDDG